MGMELVAYVKIGGIAIDHDRKERVSLSLRTSSEH